MFKGGTALKRCYFGDYRFSEDLDFTLASEIPLETILSGFEDVYAQVRSASGIPFRYSRGDRKKHQNSHTLYLAYEGPLPAASRKEVKMDITLTERFVLPIEDRVVLRGYDEYTDLTEDSKIRVYALNDIGVEEVVALTDDVPVGWDGKPLGDLLALQNRVTDQSPRPAPATADKPGNRCITEFRTTHGKARSRSPAEDSGQRPGGAVS